jgi:hypothetical protein
MYSGFHPDSFWGPPLEKNKPHPTTMPLITENSVGYETKTQ